MSSPSDVKTTYICSRGIVFHESVEEILRSDTVFIVPINYTDHVDDTKSILSLVYICNRDNVFIFDIIMLNENGLPEELIAILYSDLVKYVYSKPITFKRLGFHSSHPFGHIFDIAVAGPEYSPYCDGTEESGSNEEEEIRIEDVDWSIRPFEMQEHIRAGNRIHRLMIEVMKDYVFDMLEEY